MTELMIFHRATRWAPIAGILMLHLCGSVYSQEVTFHKLPTKVNDEVHQTIVCELNAERTIRQQNQLVDSSKQRMQRQLDRVLTILALDEGRPSQARLNYKSAVTRLTDTDDRSVESIQPVAGHIYNVQRTKQRLLITDEFGQAITEEEDEILRSHLANFGRPNPLAEFLHGKRIQVGQTIQVPEDVAHQLLGMTGNSAKTDKLGMTLAAVRHHRGKQHAVFETLMKTSSQETRMSLVMKGELVVEANTCRTHSIKLNGPVAISEVRGPAIGRFVVSTNGTLNVKIESGFREASLASKGTRLR